jgi:hypothetical protein
MDFAAGVDYRTNPTQLQEGVLTGLDNMYISPNGLTVDTGEGALGGQVRGSARGAFEHETVAGVRTLILVTDDTVYSWVVAPAEWQYISDGTETTLTADANATDTSITVASISGFSDGDYIGITMDDGTQHQTTINGAPAGSTINLDDAIPDLGITPEATSGNSVVKAKDLNGGSTKAVVFAGVPWEEWSIFTNGVDPPQRYDGSTVEDIPNLPSAGNTVCRTLDVFKSHIMLGGMIEGGTNYPYNVRWSDTGDGTNWSTGNANWKALVDTRDPVVAFKKLGDYLMIYHTKSVTRTSFLGALNEMFHFRAVNFGQSIKFEGAGVGSPNAVYATADEHVILNSKGVYIYRGGSAIEKVSDPLEPEVFGARGWFDTTKENAAFITEFERRQWLLFFVPTALVTYPNKAIVYDMTYRVWLGTRTFNIQCAAAAPRVGGSAIRYIDLVGTMAQQTWSAVSGILTGQSLSTVLCGGGGANGNVYEYDYARTAHANGSNISGELYTKLFTGMDRPFRVQWVEVEHRGQVYLYLGSDDHGWISKGPFPATGAPLQRTRVNVDRTFDEMQIRGIVIKSGSAIRSIAVKSREAARWNI